MEPILHGTDDQLEIYALGRLPDSAVPALEEHLMVCAACRERLDQTETFALGMRQALSEATLMRQATPARHTVPAKSGIGAWFARPAFRGIAFPLVFAVAMLAAVMVYYAGGGAKMTPAASLQLTATRGEMQFVPQALELDLTLVDAPPTAGPFRVEVVDAAGEAQWNSLAGGASGGAVGGISVRVRHQLAPGDYFVRLYGPADQVLHEYGFRVLSR